MENILIMTIVTCLTIATILTIVGRWLYLSFSEQYICRVYIGTEYTKDRQQLPQSYHDMVQSLSMYLTQQYGGLTVYNSLGYYQQTIEKTVVLELVSDTSLKDDRRVIELVTELKRIGSQESVLYTEQTIKYNFI